jgi:cystathionine beta-lyase/cystathionine gamma-synthase
MNQEHEKSNNAPDGWSFDTLAAHAGGLQWDPETRSGELLPSVKPVYMSNTFVAATVEEMDQVFAGEEGGYVYTRYANPTVAELERVVALLEGGEPENAVAFGSGMGALHSAFLASGVGAGDKIVASRDLYGQTWAMLNGQMRRLGIEATFVDVANLEQVLDAITTQRPKLVVMETISNPLLKVAPVERIAGAAHQVGALVLVDNTFATPYLVRPFEHGADIVVHSATKYLGGHGDTMGGVAIARTAELANELRRVRRDTGAVLSPFDAWLITRGIRTLSLRMEKQCENARSVAAWLCDHPRVEAVNYPGLDPMPLQSLYGQERGGGMVSFVIRGAGRREVFDFMERLRLVGLATTLGNLSTLVLYPVMSSHRWVDPEARQALGISDGLVRLSIGVESINDIIADLQQALAT